MKKTLTILLSVLLTLTVAASLAACGGNSAPASDAQSATQPAADQTSATEPAADSGNSAGITAEDTVFTYNNVSVTLNDEAEATIAALGEPQDVSSQLSCHGGEGDDKTYKYQGFSVGTYPKDGVDRILEVVISEAGIPTGKGVQVGDPVAKVTEAYGDSYRSVGKYYAYETDDGKSLQFFIENDTVMEIDYYYDV